MQFQWNKKVCFVAIFVVSGSNFFFMLPLSHFFTLLPCNKNFHFRQLLLNILFQPSLLSRVGKVFENLISKQLTSLFESCLSTDSTAHQRNQSYETTLLKLVESWKWEIDSNNIVIILFTDMSNKEFETLATKPATPQQTESIRLYGLC